MGKKDIQTVDYLSDNVYFADMFNAVLFRGKEVIRPSQLKDADKERKDPQTVKGEEIRHDNVKCWDGGANLATLVVEDQSDVDYHMVLRNLYAEGLYYRNQWKMKRVEHRRKNDLKEGTEYISGMRKDEKFIPTVYLIVYFGKEKWDGPRTLYELLDLEGQNELLKPFMNDYKLNIFDYHDYESFEQFQSELRVVFEFLRYSEDKEVLKKVIAAHPETYYNVSDETYQMIAVLTNTEELLINQENLENGEGGSRNMCKAFYDMIEEGRELGISEGRELGISEGREQGVAAFISACIDFGIGREDIQNKLIEKFDLDAEKAEEYMKEYWVEA